MNALWPISEGPGEALVRVGDNLVSVKVVEVSCLLRHPLFGECGGPLYTLEPLNSGHIGNDHYGEVVLFLRKCYHCIGWCIGKCHIYRGLDVAFIPTDPFAINVSTLSGHSSQFFVRPNELVVDLKEKIALSEGVPIPQQRLIFTESELRNEAVIGQTGIGEGSSLRLILIPTLPGHRQSTSYFTSCSNPSLSITHCTLGLCLNQLLPVGGASPKLLPPHLPLPPHIVHIVHMYDTPFQAWMLFVHYLYSRQLWEGL